MNTASPSPQGPQTDAVYGQHGQAPAPFSHGGDWQSVTKMPGNVRAAQILAFVMAGLCLVGTALGGVLGGPRLAGAVFAGGVLNLVVGILAFRFHRAGNGARIASIVLASVQMVFALGAVARMAGGGLVPMAGAIALVVLLSQSSAKAWFTRHRSA
ncbi:hypothetical protein [Streptomyces nigrescens]|uniref:hypothetical protein n=1 Tax=Streptomyces nigrescens TaxID=1920 RepID=UPI0036F5C2A8